MGRDEMGLSADAVSLLTLASRAIKSKGWLVSVEAFKTARKALKGKCDLRLQLIGDGPAADQIRAMGPIDGLSMIPHTNRLADYIAASDVCLLPSWFIGKSLPLTLLEFLAQGKPAVVSDIGSCPWAIGEGSPRGAVGLVVLRGPDGTVRPADLSVAMIRLAEDEDFRASLDTLALTAFSKFDMGQMIDRYAHVFASSIAAR